MKCTKILKLALNGVHVAPFGLKLCENDAPDLRIIFEPSWAPKLHLTIKHKNKNSSGGPAAGGDALRILTLLNNRAEGKWPVGCVLTLLKIGLRARDRFVYVLTLLNISLRARDRFLFIDFAEYRHEGKGSFF